MPANDVNIQDPVLLKVKHMVLDVLKKIEATKALYDLLLEYQRDSGPPFYSKNFYSESEMEELRLFQKKHLLRRIKEEAVKAGFDEFNL
jgi:hypothetical protein